ncbi:hypothetical protein F8388_023680 [Cannabis sativa]|uniref:O-fucosyltransferase family protein n=1 Tax=Cannabis sativa TaxID=3483 RepID=A0A7J6G9M6_CANSA|nr:hypothetical protein F8388_023680 [Cannabis sativa]
MESDSRLANNGIPLELQKLRCRVNYRVLKFTPKIEETGKKIVELLRRNDPFVVLNLRYEMDICWPSQVALKVATLMKLKN